MRNYWYLITFLLAAYIFSSPWPHKKTGLLDMVKEMSGPAGLTQPVQVTRDHYIFSLFPLRLKHPFCSPFSSPSSRAKARLLLSPIFLLFLFFWSVVTIDHDRCFDAAFCVCRCSVRVGERESRR